MDHLTPDGPPLGPVTVVIVDDHQMVLDGLKAMLAPYRDQVEIVGESSDPREAVRLAGELKPDAVLLDVRLRGASGLDLCAEILRVTPGCKVVFLTVYDDEQYLYQALRVGAAGFLLKRIRGCELVDYLRRIFDGEVLDRPQPGRPGRAVRGPAAQRRVLARRPPGPDPAGERGAVPAGRPGCPTGPSRCGWWSARRR